MRYREFEFRNFKGIDQLTLALDGGVTTLIGLNESGKTTILEAIFCFSYGAEDLDVIDPNMASLREPERWIPISRRANFNDDTTISAVLEWDTGDKAELKKFMLESQAIRLTEIPDTIRISEVYKYENSRHTGKSGIWDLDLHGTRGRQRNPREIEGEDWRAAVKYLKERLPRVWYFPNFLFELPERFELSEPAGATEEERDKSRFYKSTFEQILDDLDYGANLDTHVVKRLGSSEKADQRSLTAVLLGMGRTITKTIFEGWDRIFGRAPAAQEVVLAADSDASGNPYLELRIKGPDGYYDLSERSLGFRWFFMFLLMTSFHGLSKEGAAKPLFLLDEPASNLHSSAQAELLKSFESLSSRCNLIYTTHSHHLINIRWLDSAYVVKNAALGSLDFADYVTSRMGARTSISATRYRKFVAENPGQTSYFQPVLDLLDYRPSTVEPVPNVVLVEGKSDFYLMRYAREVLNLDEGLTLVPGTGAGTLDPLIRLHVGWGKSFLVLLDGDSEGKKQLKRYEKNFGGLVSGRLVLLPHVCDDAGIVEAEDLLSQADTERLLSAVYAPGVQRPAKKKALSQAIMELYSRREVVELDDETRDRLANLAARLRGLLSTD